MLFLLFQLGNDRYALEANRVVEVVPMLALKKIPQAPRGVAGIFVYRGYPVPALDLCELTFGRPAQERLSTRIIIINYSQEVPGAECQVSGAKLQETNLTPDPSHLAPQLLGLIAERATETMRRESTDFVDPGVKLASTPFLGPVLMDERGVIQLLHAQKLLAETMRDLVFAPTVEVTP